MGGSPKPPPAPDPVVQQKIATEGAQEAAKIQGEYNLKALQQSQAASMINQSTPIGSVNYTQRGTDSNGNPLWALNAQFSPQQQGLYDTTVGSKQTAANTASNLFRTSAPMYSNAQTMMKNLYTGADSLTAQRVNAAIGFQKPFQDQDRRNLDNQLRNQGIFPGMPAYDMQMSRLDNSQYGNNQNFIANVLPQSMAEADTIYSKPLQTAQQLAAMGQSDVIQQMQTPQFAAKPADFTTSYGQSLNSQNANYSNQIAGYNAQLQSQSNMMNGIFGLAGGAMKLAPLMMA